MTHASNSALDAIHDLQVSRVQELETVLREARLQIEYLQEKFQETGTGNALLARIESVLDRKR